MSDVELLELLDRVKGAIRDYSEELVQQLARRDELEFEKEVKNSFITVLIEVQNKQKEHRELMKRRRKEKGLSLQSSRIERATQMPLKVGEKSRHSFHKRVQKAELMGFAQKWEFQGSFGKD